MSSRLQYLCTYCVWIVENIHLPRVPVIHVQAEKGSSLNWRGTAVYPDKGPVCTKVRGPDMPCQYTDRWSTQVLMELLSHNSWFLIDMEVSIICGALGYLHFEWKLVKIKSFSHRKQESLVENNSWDIPKHKEIFPSPPRSFPLPLNNTLTFPSCLRWQLVMVLSNI